MLVEASKGALSQRYQPLQIKIKWEVNLSQVQVGIKSLVDRVTDPGTCGIKK